MINTKRYAALALDWCNARRAERGQDLLPDLPKGDKADPHSCPCGVATGLYVGSRRYIDENNQWIALPNGVQTFIKLFDDGLIPEYDSAVTTSVGNG